MTGAKKVILNSSKNCYKYVEYWVKCAPENSAMFVTLITGEVIQDGQLWTSLDLSLENHLLWNPL